MCDGKGTCADNPPVSCAGLACNAMGTECLTSCAADSDCVSGDYGLNAQCTPKLASGVACTAANQCANGFCVDGLCCNTDCQGFCGACSAAKKGQGVDGECGAIVAGSDPDNECDQESAASCGKTGTCDGSGACSLYGNSTFCVNASCSSGTAQPARNCDGFGTCTPKATVSCGALLCDAQGIACLGACSADSDCVAGDYCSNSQCTPKLANGAVCTAANQCTNGFCVDGVCCNASCGGLCQACNVAGSVGACSNIPSGSDPANECFGGTSCNGAGACALFSNGTACSSASECSGGYCFGTPNVCHSNARGNGTYNAGEACDDGNNTNGDGCSSTCVIEPGHKCSGSPSVCGPAGSCPVSILGPKSVGGYSWYLGLAGQSCNTTCAAKGLTYNTATLSYAGSGGSQAQCGNVVTAFGRTLWNATWSCAQGWGCMNDSTQSQSQWCQSPATDATSPDSGSYSGICRYCACN
jgi:cysteine-rich repeat protein